MEDVTYNLCSRLLCFMEIPSPIENVSIINVNLSEIFENNLFDILVETWNNPAVLVNVPFTLSINPSKKSNLSSETRWNRRDSQHHYGPCGWLFLYAVIYSDLSSLHRPSPPHPVYTSVKSMWDEDYINLQG